MILSNLEYCRRVSYRIYYREPLNDNETCRHKLSINKTQVMHKKIFYFHFLFNNKNNKNEKHEICTYNTDERC